MPAAVAAATVRRIRAELRAMPHAAHALTWLREPKCVASSSTLDRIRASLETAGLARFFEPNLFSASDVPNGKPAPDLFLYAAELLELSPEECVVVEDAAAGIEAGRAGGFRTIGLGPVERVGEADIMLTSLEGAKLESVLSLLGDSDSDQTGS